MKQRDHRNAKIRTITATNLPYFLLFTSAIFSCTVLGQCDLDSFEPNNDKSTATSVTSGSSYPDLTICTFNDVYDWYHIEHSGSTAVYRFALDYDSSQGDLTALGYNVSSYQMSEINSADPKSIGVILGGVYGNSADVLIQRGTTHTDVQQTSYSLAVSQGSCSEDRFEPNDLGKPAWITVGTINTGLTLCGNDYDLYQMVFFEATDLTITITGQGNLVTNIVLLDNTGAAAITNTDGTQQQKVLKYHFDAAGSNTLELKIWPTTFQTSTGVYTLLIEQAAPSTTFTTGGAGGGDSGTTGDDTATTGGETSSTTSQAPTTVLTTVTQSVVVTTPTGSVSASASQTAVVTTDTGEDIRSSSGAATSNVAAIAGGVAGGIIALILIAVVAAVLIRKHKRRPTPPVEEGRPRPAVATVTAAAAVPAAAAARTVYHNNSFSNIDRSDVIPYTDLEMKQKIGEGSFGTVYKAKWRNSTVAVKEVSQALLNEQSIESFKKEANVMRNLRPHPNVVLFLGISLPPDPTCIVTEYMKNGSLNDYLKKNPNLPSAAKLKLLLGISNGMLHLHREGIIHRDLAARNILLGSNLEPKVSDFGMARRVRGPEQVGKTYNSVGPLKWMAPESVLGNTYSYMSDVWSFGVVCFEVLAGSEPYPELNAVQVAYQVIHQGLLLSFPPDTGLSPALIRLFETCFERDPNARPNFETLCANMDTHLRAMRSVQSDSSSEDLNHAAPAYEYQFTPSEPGSSSDGSKTAVSQYHPIPR